MTSFFLVPNSFGEKFWRAHLLMRRKFSAVQEHCPPEKLLATRYSLLAAVLPVANRQSPFAFTIRYSPFATRCGFAPFPFPKRTRGDALEFVVPKLGAIVAWSG
jgi:hypothetical protein